MVRIYRSDTNALTSQWNCLLNQIVNPWSWALRLISLSQAYAGYRGSICNQNTGICVLRNPQPRRAMTIYSVSIAYVLYVYNLLRLIKVPNIPPATKENKKLQSAILYQHCIYVVYTKYILLPHNQLRDQYVGSRRVSYCI